jgi:hypothetical protein
MKKEELYMNQAAQLSKELEQLNVAEGMDVILKSTKDALWFETVEDVMTVMHKDGSVNFFDNRGRGIITCEVISAANILKVLRHYRPFKEVFKGNIQ